MTTDSDELRAHDNLNDAFRSGSIFDAAEPELRRHLQTLAMVEARNPGLQYREIIRCLTINHLQMARAIAETRATMRQLNASNARLQWFAAILTAVGLFVGIVQLAG
jgi:hypothetical protein